MDDEPGLACVACCVRACVGMCMYAWYVISVVYPRDCELSALLVNFNVPKSLIGSIFSTENRAFFPGTKGLKASLKLKDIYVLIGSNGLIKTQAQNTCVCLTRSPADVRSAFCVVLWCVGCQGVYLNMRVCRYVRVCVCS